MVLSVVWKLFNPLNQKKWGVYENIPSGYLETFFFFLLSALMVRSKLLHSLPNLPTSFFLASPSYDSEQVPHSLPIFFWKWIWKQVFFFFVFVLQKNKFFFVLTFFYFFSCIYNNYFLYTHFFFLPLFLLWWW